MRSRPGPLAAGPLTRRRNSHKRPRPPQPGRRVVHRHCTTARRDSFGRLGAPETSRFLSGSRIKSFL